jgi:hypothetical protein
MDLSQLLKREKWRDGDRVRVKVRRPEGRRNIMSRIECRGGRTKSVGFKVSRED